MPLPSLRIYKETRWAWKGVYSGGQLAALGGCRRPLGQVGQVGAAQPRDDGGHRPQQGEQVQHDQVAPVGGALQKARLQQLGDGLEVPFTLAAMGCIVASFVMMFFAIPSIQLCYRSAKPWYALGMVTFFSLPSRPE